MRQVTRRRSQVLAVFRNLINAGRRFRAWWISTAWAARIDMGAVEMAAAGPALLGDYNLNHSVDAADYVLWRKTNGTSVAQPYSGADGDGNSAVNSNDYTVWRSHFGNTSPGAGSAAQELSDEPAAFGVGGRIVWTARMQPPWRLRLWQTCRSLARHRSR